MKKVIALAVAALMLAGLLSACSSESSSVSAESTDENTIMFIAENGSVDSSVNGNITVSEGEILVIAPNLTEGKVNITVSREGSESEMPSIEWEFEGVEPTEYMPNEGEYEVVFTVTQKANGIIEIYTKSGNENMTGMPNPWREADAAEANGTVPRLFKAPDGAEGEHWSIMNAQTGEDELVELDFAKDGISYNARAQVTGDDYADISGMYYEWGEPEEVSLPAWGFGNMTGKVYTFDNGDEAAKLCTWYDVEIGISYSLSVAATPEDIAAGSISIEDIAAVDIAAMTNSMYEPANEPLSDMPDEE